jgi:hypothetical protein
MGGFRLRGTAQNQGAQDSGGSGSRNPIRCPEHPSNTHPHPINPQCLGSALFWNDLSSSCAFIIILQFTHEKIEAQKSHIPLKM